MNTYLTEVIIDNDTEEYMKSSKIYFKLVGIICSHDEARVLIKHVVIFLIKYCRN